ncbi:hypothetical protein A5784_20985 [Mycobacterium sp. 852013-50091_SCH5140682]|uniref:hypothetical protein n=1 Tax=Mycobacterium sp. 852013-50091_SCH5140682 TaxID=1834109 RepID=UPI0007E9FA9B|nr:hypothetical protein [Mycobacterium sp. 852013-50091_SCH5140682]OBC00016.1 hypothetical protein A5784_20985 [Mycobacterium sp. 852013-50091_SCH5140682]
MSTFPQSANPVRGGFVLVDPDTGRPVKTIAFQYNPDTLTRTLQPQGIGGEPGDRLEALRLKGPPHESLKFDAEFDATDAPEKYPDGLYPVLSALELSIYPTTAQLRAEDQLVSGGQLEIAPAESALMVLVLGPKRVLPVRLTDVSIAEEAFDQALNPIRAKVSIGVRVLTVDDLGFRHKGGLLYLSYQDQKQRFAATVNDPITAVGVNTI